MPIYEYQCQVCGHRGEELQRLSDPPLAECPVCGGPYKKLISAPAFQFKGSGWYITDYARKEKGKEGRAGKEEAAAGDGAKGEAAKGEGKGEPKGEKGAAGEAGKAEGKKGADKASAGS